MFNILNYQKITAIRFYHINKQLSYFFDGKQVGKSQAIDNTGLDNWGLGNDDKIDVGIIVFADNTTIQTNSPKLEKFEVKLY